VDPGLDGSGAARSRLLAELPTAASPELRAAIIEALPRTGDGWAQALLRHLPQEPDEAVRKVAIAVLRWADEVNRARGIHLGLRDDAAIVRMEAAIVASHLPRRALLQSGLAAKLVELLTDEDPRTRAMAVRTSGLRNLGEIRPALPLLAVDPAARVRREAGRAARRLQ
jgi:HEAT repeat protein